MAQNPLAATVAVNAGTQKQLAVDADGNLTVGAAVADGYQVVAASQTAKVLGATGAIGDVIDELVILLATAAAGVVTLIDGSGGGAVSIPISVGGGTTAFPSLAPIVVPLNIASKVGGWHITTGANVSVLAIGKFTA